MDIKCYLAMTAAEFFAADILPDLPAWMACHFSCYGTGLSNLPPSLPEGAMLIVNDRTPPHGHDPELIAAQLRQILEESQVSCILLDFQRPDMAENAEIARHLTQALPCPVGVSAGYARELVCPVFLCAPPPHCKLSAQLAPWAGREIWLEAATETEIATVTEEGSLFSSNSAGFPESPGFADDVLHCRYHTEIFEDRAVFTLQRGIQEVLTMLEEAEKLGVSQAVGLYQQLGAGFANMSADR